MTDDLIPDPRRELMSHRRFEPGVNGAAGYLRPIPLAEAAAGWRELMEFDDKQRLAMHLEYPDEGETIVYCAPAQARLLVLLLEEIALRLAPGLAVGPIDTDAEVSDTVRAAAQRLKTLI